MAVHLIIDGYNLIRQSPYLSQIDGRSIEDGRDALLELLHEYRRIRGHRITVVFDGKYSYNLSRERERIKGIDVIYSRRGEEADSIIEEIAREKRHGVTVVTSDTSVLKRVEGYGSVGITSQEFEVAIQEAIYGGGDIEDEDKGYRIQKGKMKGLSRRPSKKEKLKKKRLKKL